MDNKVFLPISCILVAGLLTMSMATASVENNSLVNDPEIGDPSNKAIDEIPLCRWTTCGNPWPKCHEPNEYETNIARCGFLNRKKRRCCRNRFPQFN